MDRYDLVRALGQAAVADALYEIPGVHEPRMRPDAFYTLRQEAGSWVVGLNERAQEEILGRFPTEDAACRYLLDALVPVGEPPTPPAGAETAAEVLRHTEEIQRQAWEQFRRALASESGEGQGGSSASDDGC